MKSRILLLAMFAFLASLFTGCTTRGLADKLAEFERLGITEAQITGKFSNTTYVVEKKDGTRTATLDHSNAWMPKIRLVRRTSEPAPAPEPAPAAPPASAK